MKLWLGPSRGYAVDWVTQRWVQVTGRRIAPGECPWLEGPVGAATGIGADFYDRLASEQALVHATGSAPRGLTSSFAQLQGPRFDPSCIDPRIIAFYEKTSLYRMDAWSEWCGAFRPFGWLLAVLFSRRLQQLNMPLSPLDTSRGISSEVVHLIEPATGALRNVGWVRKLPRSHHVVYVGDYSTSTVPGFAGPCVRVVFPLPNGSATVVLWPEAQPDGSLVLHSSGERFGDPGFYFVVKAKDGPAYARYVASMKESIHVYPQSSAELGTDHEFRIWGATYLRLHYRLSPRPIQSAAI